MVWEEQASQILGHSASLNLSLIISARKVPLPSTLIQLLLRNNSRYLGCRVSLDNSIIVHLPAGTDSPLQHHYPCRLLWLSGDAIVSSHSSWLLAY